MSNSVSYVLNIPGHRFNERLEPPYIASDNEIIQFAQNGVLLEGRLPNTEVEFSAQITGEITLLWLSTSYSTFCFDARSHTEIRDWEQILKQAITPAEAIRIDEFLLDRWEEVNGDQWYKNKESFVALLKWLEEHETEGWTRF